ncbi:MAG: hypothetical protein HQK52_05670 [Oligoflexia bacterium]|nr:hypothetical protein [Oligoflexia bacterium]
MSWYRRRRRSSRYSSYSSYFPPYVSVAEKQRLAAKTLEKLKKENPHLSPVIIQGRTYATTWWGKAWNNNLTRYADFSNRIGRGRSYVANGAVLDLQLKEGEIHSIVQGSSSNPYRIVIKIAALNDSLWKSIKKSCSNKLNSLSELLTGKLPKDIGEIFTAVGSGLFPEAKSMKFDCSCPDGAHMCKHVAATLYGVGSRLDQDPSLLFKLRKVNMKELIHETLVGVKDQLQQKAKDTESSKKKSRIISDTNVGELFGIDVANTNSAVRKVKKKSKTAIKSKGKVSKVIKVSKVSKVRKISKVRKKNISITAQKAVVAQKKLTSKRKSKTKAVPKRKV